MGRLFLSSRIEFIYVYIDFFYWIYNVYLKK